ncbi:MAG TPA: metal ABC transporter permease, partial [Xylella fastidiosa subsp. pauca]
MNIPMIFPSIAAPGFFVNLDVDKWKDIGRATLDTLFMVGGALPPALALGLPLGIALYLCNTSQLRSHPLVYTLLALAVNLLRSVPFIILMI